MTLWRPKSGQLTRPIYLSLQRQFIDAIESGALFAGEQLPTHRDLAYDLNISVQTVSRAYEALRDLGYVTGEVGRGSFVRASRGDNAVPFLPSRGEELIDLSLLKPALESLHRDAMSRALHTLADRLPFSLVQSFRPDAAVQTQISGISNWLNGHGVRASPDNILLTNGAVSALTAALMTAAPPGAVVIAEAISFHVLKPLCRYLGLRLFSAEMDEQGLCPEALERACTSTNPSVVVLFPTACGPKAGVMSTERRNEIVAIAEKYSLFIIEDDVLGKLIPDAPPPIQSIAPDRTFYISSFSKTIMPGLHFGVLVCPDIKITSARNRHMMTNWMANPLMVDIAQSWMSDGTADELILWQRRELTHRQGLVAKALSGFDYSCHPCGLHLWLPLPAAWEEAEFVQQLRRQNVAVAGSLPFIMQEQSSGGKIAPANAVRICLGTVGREPLIEALVVMRGLLDGQSERPLPAF